MPGAGLHRATARARAIPTPSGSIGSLVGSVLIWFCLPGWQSESRSSPPLRMVQSCADSPEPADHASDGSGRHGECVEDFGLATVKTKPKPRRIRRILKWAGVGACMLILSVWGLSLFRIVTWSNRTCPLIIGNGTLALIPIEHHKPITLELWGFRISGTSGPPHTQEWRMRPTGISKITLKSLGFSLPQSSQIWFSSNLVAP